jgi:hypothetical protein
MKVNLQKRGKDSDHGWARMNHVSRGARFRLAQRGGVRFSVSREYTDRPLEVTLKQLTPAAFLWDDIAIAVRSQIATGLAEVEYAQKDEVNRKLFNTTRENDYYNAKCGQIEQMRPL